MWSLAQISKVTQDQEGISMKPFINHLMTWTAGLELQSITVEGFTHSTILVLLDLSSCREQPGAILYPGQWSKKGCVTNFNSTMTVCKCNHLTHFAILLSARPLNLSPQKTLALQITGYIGVSISLVAMAITVIVFLFLKWVIQWIPLSFFVTMAVF